MSTDSRLSEPAHASPWASGLTVFAGTLMIIDGVFGVLTGITALLNDKIYVTTPGYVYAYDLTTWGWIHLLLGVLIGFAGVAVLRGQTWGRVTGMVMAGVSLIANFMFIPHYPVWSIVIIALDVAIIWALAVYRRDPV
jgi:hypothetical protein